MAISLDKALGLYENSLTLRSMRSEVIANNIANADTPGYKARDIDFQSMLANRMQEVTADVGMAKTQSGHQNGNFDAAGFNGLKYRNPTQPSIDGNTVDGEIEKTAYTRNAMRFQSSFLFLNGGIKGIIGAIRGE